MTHVWSKENLLELVLYLHDVDLDNELQLSVLAANAFTLSHLITLFMFSILTY